MKPTSRQVSYEYRTDGDELVVQFEGTEVCDYGHCGIESETIVNIEIAGVNVSPSDLPAKLVKALYQYALFEE